MEQFVQLTVAGGLVLLAGLWGTALAARWGPAWAASVVAALVGSVALAVGIRSELTV
jgi:hypothetical protein